MLTIKGKQFCAYPPEEGVAIIRTIAEHRWPMTINEAFALRDQFGWKPAPDDGTIFTTPVSNGEEDGYIGNDVTNTNLVSRIRFKLTSRISQELAIKENQTLKNLYLSYVDSITSLYGKGDHDSDALVASSEWILPSRASVYIGATQYFISATIESPAMLDLTEAEQRYFDEGGEL
ncbi:hypothetical protein BKH16_02540 [Actinomyces oris]|nr:hypothetical protein BKH16_02540 [Actinomyces oris]